jgi:mono/diheme cytochrome c family protein
VLPALLLAGIAFIGPGCGKGGDSSSSTGGASAYVPDVDTGKEVYHQACINCHGPTGAGMPHNGAPLTTSVFVASHTDAELAKFIKDGRPAWAADNKSGVAMPANGNVPGGLDDDRLLDVVAFLRQIQAKAKANPAAAAATTAPAVTPAH